MEKESPLEKILFKGIPVGAGAGEGKLRLLLADQNERHYRLVERMYGNHGLEYYQGEDINPKTKREVAKICEGEVIVASPMVFYFYDLLLYKASAIIFDNSGTLTHCAAWAREFKIPAIGVSNEQDLDLLQEGMTIKVDGTIGIVYQIEDTSTE